MITFWFIAGIVLSGSLICKSSPTVPRNLGWLEVIGRSGNISNKYQPLTALDAKASVNCRYFIEKFRHFLDTGLGKIPSLDPYTNIKPIPPEINSEDIQGTINLANFLMRGVKTFELDILEIRLHSARVDFSIRFPMLQTDVDYYAYVTVDKAHNYLAGHANVTLMDVIATGAISLTGSPEDVALRDQILKISGIEYELSTSKALYNLRDTWPIVDDSSGQRRYRRSVDGVASLVIRTIAQEIAEQSSYSTARSIVKVFNTILSHYSAAQILALLLPEYDIDNV